VGSTWILLTHTKGEFQMTVNEALQNIDIIIANTKMNRQEHDALRQSVTLVVQRCKLADELEKEKQAAKVTKKEVK
jgi:hypothetical protein